MTSSQQNVQKVQKRSGRLETFSPGRLALAVSQAALAQELNGEHARRLGQQVALKVQERARLIFAANVPAPAEWITQAALQALEELDEHAVQMAWEDYDAQRGKAPTSRESKAWVVGEGTQRQELGWRQWEAALESLSSTLGQTWDGAKWARAALKKNAKLASAPNWDEFFGAWAVAARGTEDKASPSRAVLSAALLSQQSSMRALQAAPLLQGAAHCAQLAREGFLRRAQARSAAQSQRRERIQARAILGVGLGRSRHATSASGNEWLEASTVWGAGALQGSPTSSMPSTPSGTPSSSSNVSVLASTELLMGWKAGAPSKPFTPEELQLVAREIDPARDSALSYERQCELRIWRQKSSETLGERAWRTAWHEEEGPNRLSTRLARPVGDEVEVGASRGESQSQEGLSDLLPSLEGRRQEYLDRLPCQAFAELAVLLHECENGPDRAQKAALFTRWQMLGLIQMPARTLALAWSDNPTFCPQWAFDAGINAHAAALALSRATQALSSGAAVSMELSGLPARQEGAGGGGPVAWARALSSAAEGCAVPPGQSRAWLETWHADFLEFLELAAEPAAAGRLGIWACDALARRAIEGAQWALVDPALEPRLGSAFGAAFALRMDDAIARIEAGELKGRVLPAKVVWDALSTQIARGGGLSLAFKEPLAGIRERGERLLPSASAHWALPAGDTHRIGAPEGVLDWGAASDWAQAQAACASLTRALDNAVSLEPDLALDTKAQGWRFVAQGAARWPQLAQAQGLSLLQMAQRVGWCARDRSAQLAMERGAFVGAARSFWASADPWANRQERVREQRSGYWGQEALEAAPTGGLPRNASLLALALPEPGIERALSGELPEASQGTARLRQQVDWAALAQAGVDMGVQVEITPESASPAAVGQALQLAWLRGVRAARIDLGVEGEKRAARAQLKLPGTKRKKRRTKEQMQAAREAEQKQKQ